MVIEFRNQNNFMVKVNHFFIFLLLCHEYLN